MLAITVVSIHNNAVDTDLQTIYASFNKSVDRWIAVSGVHRVRGGGPGPQPPPRGAPPGRTGLDPPDESWHPLATCQLDCVVGAPGRLTVEEGDEHVRVGDKPAIAFLVGGHCVLVRDDLDARRPGDVIEERLSLRRGPIAGLQGWMKRKHQTDLLAPVEEFRGSDLVGAYRTPDPP